MPVRNIPIPVDDPLIPATLIYLCEEGPTHECGNLMYLQGIRTGTLAAASQTGDPNDTAWAKTYRAILWQHTGKLANEVLGPVSAIVSPPSRFPEHALPYREALKKKFSNAIDLSERFQRAKDVFSGSDASFADVCNALTYDRRGDEGQIDSLLIVDDVFSRGRTAAALVVRLREAGVATSSKVTVAFALWLPRSSA